MSDFFQILCLGLIAISCSLIGPFIVLRKMAMYVNALSHTILLGIVLAALAFGANVSDLFVLLLAALLAALFTAFCTEGLIRYLRVKEDAATALSFSTLFALGIILVSLFMKNTHLGIESVMGNLDLVGKADVKLAFFVFLINLSVVVLFFRRLKVCSFDPEFARVSGMKPAFVHLLLLCTVSLTCVAAFRLIGVLLVLAFLVGPFLAMRFFFQSLKPLLISSCAFSLIAVVGGIFLSQMFYELWDLPLSSAGIVTALIGVFYLLAKWGARLKSRHEKKDRSFGEHGFDRNPDAAGGKPS